MAMALCVVIPITAIAAENGYKVSYDGGSIPDAKTGAEMRVTMASDFIMLTTKNGAPFKIPVASVTEISYGQDVHRRVGAAVALGLVTLGAGALLALAKSKKHFIGIIWDDGPGKKGGIAFQADKSDYRGLLAGLEGVTGKKAINSETMGVKN
jgi:hypothetical protein